MKSNRQVWGIVFIVFGVLVLSGALVRHFSPVNFISAKTQQVFDQIGNNLPNMNFDGVNNVTDPGSQTFDASHVSKLVLTNKAGKIRITADPNAKQATVNYVKGLSLHLNSADAQQRFQNVQVKLQTSGDTEHVDVEYNDNTDFFRNAYVNFDIVVPPTMAVEVQNNAGEVVTSGLANSINVHLNAGKIEVDGFKNTADVHTNAGEVIVSNGTDIRRIDAETNAGAVKVNLPETANLALDAGTNVGSISCDFPLSVEKHIPGSSLHGSIGTGKDGTVTMHTNTGAISISKQ
jgi:DUF4097 and DUF4098 domain-containing protein YvlB